MLNRRQFLQSTTTASMGAALIHPAFAFPVGGTFLLEGAATRALSPYLLGEDLLRLLQLVDFNKMVRQALTVNGTHFQLGKVWSIPDIELLKVAQDAKRIWNSEMEQDRAHTQYALFCGCLAHRTFEQYFPTEQGNQLSERVLYQDTYLLKMLQNADIHRKQLPVDSPLEGVTEAAVAELFHIIQQRNLIRMHTLRPEFSDVSAWLEQFLAYYQQMKLDNHAYAKIYCQPVKPKVQQYIVEPNFYDAKETIIQATRHLQLGLSTGANNLLASTNQPKSLYGKALDTALAKMKICEQYILGKTDDKTLLVVMK